MTIYWEQCDVCSRHYVVRNCTLHSDINICIYCCTSCLERERCPKPVWIIVSEKPAQQQVRKMNLEDKKKLMEDLLSKLRKTS